MVSIEEESIVLVKGLVQKFMDGNAEGYLEGCHEDFYGKIFSGLIPGGEDIKGKDSLVKMFGLLPEYLDIIKFEPVNWAAVGNTVYFTVNWEFVWKKTGKLVKTAANVRKVVRDGKICEKYHIVNYADVLGKECCEDKDCCDVSTDCCDAKECCSEDKNCC